LKGDEVLNCSLHSANLREENFGFVYLWKVGAHWISDETIWSAPLFLKQNFGTSKSFKRMGGFVDFTN
jgi:hypothetical protein